MKYFRIIAILLTILIAPQTLLAKNYGLYVQGLGGVSDARTQSGFVLDTNGNRDLINDYNFGNMTGLVGVELGFDSKFFAAGVMWSHRADEMGSGVFEDNAGAIESVRIKIHSNQLLFMARLYVDRLFGNTKPFKVFLSGGVGKAYNKLGDLQLGNITTAGLLPGTLSISGASNKPTAYQYGGGISAELHQHIYVFIQYLNMHLGHVHSGVGVNLNLPAIQRGLNLDFHTQVIVAGLGFLIN